MYDHGTSRVTAPTSVAFLLSNSTWFHSGSISTEAIPALGFTYSYWRAETGMTAVETEIDTETINEDTIITKTT